MTDEELENEIHRAVREKYEGSFRDERREPISLGALWELIKTVFGFVVLGFCVFGFIWLFIGGTGLLHSGADWLQHPQQASKFFHNDFLDWSHWSREHPFTIFLWVAGIILFVFVQSIRPQMTDAQHAEVIFEQRKRTRELLTLLIPWVPTLRQAVAMSAKYIRVIGIWIFGLLGSAIIGGLIAAHLASPDSDSGVWLIFGVPAGMFSFACIRLWFGGPAKA